VRSARFIVWLALRRLGRRDSGALLASAGLAVATAVLAGVLGGVTIASDRSTAQAIERIPAAERSVRAVWFGVPASSDESRPLLDGHVRAALADLPLGEPTPLVLVRESTVAGRFVGLTAIDGVAPHVILRSGRLPQPCTPRRCEVLRLRGRGGLPNAPGLRIVQVGTATLRSRQLYGDFLEPTDNATADAETAPALRESGRYHRPAPGPLVVAEGVDALVSAPALARTYRTYAWVWHMSAGKPRLWQVDGLIGHVERARAELTARSGSFAVDAPEEELRTAERSATVAGRRLLLVGGEAAALLLAFAVLAARGLRRDFDDTRRRLTWYGARRWQLTFLAVVECALVALAGVLAGWTVGSAAAALAASLSGAPVASILSESVLAPGGLLLLAAVTVVTTGLMFLAVWLRTSASSRFGVAELVGGFALAVAAVALLSGAVDEERLASGEGSALLLLLLPALVVVAAATAAGRLFPRLAAIAANRERGRVSTRLASVGLARGPGAAVVTVAFLTIAFALALLAEGYRATLTRGEREQAAFRVPLDVTVREDLQALVRVFDAAPLARFRDLAGRDGEAYPVLRVSASAGRAELVTGITVLGLDGDAVERLRVWRSAWAGGKGRDELFAEIDTGDETTLRGIALPRGSVLLRAGPSLVSFAMVVATPEAGFRRVELGATDARRPSVLRARVPAGSRLVSVELVPQTRILERGADAGTALQGAMRLEGPLARELASWIGVDGVEVRPTREGVELRYVLTPQRTARLRARQPTDTEPPAVLVTPRLAEVAGGVGGTLPLQVGGQVVPVSVANVVERFPGVETEDAVIGERSALRTAINAQASGAALENEVWLDVPDEDIAGVEDALARPPLAVLAATSRQRLEEDARGDPLAHGTLLTLAAAAIVALALAAIGLALAVRSDLRDDRGELFELEAQGASPALLRRVVRVRVLLLSSAGLLAGTVTGIGLLTLVTRVVSVTARGGSAEPPLVSSLEPLVLAGGVAAFVALGALLVGVTTQRGFSGSRGPAFRGED
jgi:hypothetical protein